MKVIVLTGLVVVEKAQLANDLATHFAGDQSVMMLDNIARLPIETVSNNVLLRRFDGDNLTQLQAILYDATVDTVIIAISEQSHPERLFITLDQLQNQLPNFEIYTLALIDTRTCDCFPTVRQALTSYADATIMLPYDMNEVLSYVSST